MNSALLRLAILAVSVTSAMPGAVRAQPVLVGCTGNATANSPTSKIVDIDPVSGAASNPRDTGIFLLAGIARQPSTGTLFGLTTLVSNPANSLITIDIATGTPTLVGSVGLSGIVEGDLAFNPFNGFLYGLQTGTGPGVQRNIFRIDP